MKRVCKYELAEAAGVSRTTFWRWMKENEAHLVQLGVKPSGKLLPPKAVEWICREYGIDYPLAA